MAAFESSLAKLARIDDAKLEQDSPWLDGTADVRYVVVYSAMEREQQAAAAAPPPEHESALILRIAQTAFGDLRGLLCGVPAEALDAVPREGQWTVRETLAHAIATERSYLDAVLYALERGDGDPVARPASRRPSPDAHDTGGDAVDIAQRFGQRRAETDAALAALDRVQLALPSVWSGFSIDVRFRLHRFASHLVEHTIQAETALDALGLRGSDAARAARRISALRGSHERTTTAETVADLDRQLAAAIERS
ncbi:MAG: DinB family protein [Candidatus Limnocylindria bacterium]